MWGEIYVGSGRLTNSGISSSLESSSSSVGWTTALPLPVAVAVAVVAVAVVAVSTDDIPSIGVCSVAAPVAPPSAAAVVVVRSVLLMVNLLSLCQNART